MKGIMIYWMALLVFVLASCGRDEPEPEDDDTFTRLYYREISAYQGDTVAMRGKYLGNDPSIIALTVDGVACPLHSICDDSIRFVIPAVLKRYEQKRSVSLVLEWNYQGEPYRLDMTAEILFREQGWFYQARVFSREGMIGVSKDTVTWFSGRDGTFKFDHHGWKQNELIYFDDRNSLSSTKAACLDKNTAWFSDRNENYILYTQDGRNLQKYSPVIEVAENAGNILGIWMDGWNSGLIVYDRGLILGIDDFSDRFGAVNPIYAETCQLSGEISALGKYEFAAAGRFRNDKGDTQSYFILHKTEREWPQEYTVPESAYRIQMLNTGTVYFNSTSNNLYRITWPFHLEKLTQKASAFYFVDEYTGHAAYGQVIYKTTDGGATWEEDFSFDAGLEVVNMCGIQGNVWLLLSEGENSIGHMSGKIILKYTPKQ
ncbi:MAG: IPT/TIG domain-containing protein [Bacteroidales bacterium]|jgi:hypothetical protein|nr:IPT/TIG domain-containing protein [Bacteroidales bacterium]